MIRLMDRSTAIGLSDIDAVGQAALAAAGEVTATELLEAAIVRLEAARALNAVIADLFDRGRQQADCQAYQWLGRYVKKCFRKVTSQQLGCCPQQRYREYEKVQQYGDRHQLDDEEIGRTVEDANASD